MATFLNRMCAAQIALVIVGDMDMAKGLTESAGTNGWKSLMSDHHTILGAVCVKNERQLAGQVGELKRQYQ